MSFLLDTNFCIALIKRKPQIALLKIANCQPGQLFISSISAAELRFGACKSKHSEQNHMALDQFFVPYELLEFDELSAFHYGVIRSQLESNGTPIGPLDTLIAAQAVAHDLTLVTNNIREFQRVKRLRIEDWTVSA